MTLIVHVHGVNRRKSGWVCFSQKIPVRVKVAVRVVILTVKIRFQSALRYSRVDNGLSAYSIRDTVIKFRNPHISSCACLSSVFLASENRFSHLLGQTIFIGTDSVFPDGKTRHHGLVHGS